MKIWLYIFIFICEVCTRNIIFPVVVVFPFLLSFILYPIKWSFFFGWKGKNIYILYHKPRFFYIMDGEKKLCLESHTTGDDYIVSFVGCCFALFMMLFNSIRIIGTKLNWITTQREREKNMMISSRQWTLYFIMHINLEHSMDDGTFILIMEFFI